MRRFYLAGALLTAMFVAAPAGQAEEREAARAALTRLETAFGDDLRVHWPELRSAPARVSGLRWTTEATSPADIGAAFLAEFRDLIGASPEALTLVETEGTRRRTVLRYRQSWQGIPVLGGEVFVTLDREGRVLSLASSTVRTIDLDASKDLGREVAIDAAVRRVFDDDAAHPAAATRVVLPGPGGPVLAWRVLVPTVPMVQKIVCLVDAATGEVLQVRDEVIR